jgi:hypothetical protein
MYYYPLYARTIGDDTFTGYTILDPQDTLRQLASYLVPSPIKGVLFLYGVVDDYYNPSQVRYLSRLYEPIADSLTSPQSVSPLVYNISLADSFYWYSIGYSQAMQGLMYYRFSDYLSLPFDSAFVGEYFYPQLTLDNLSGKYVVMNDNSWKAYLTTKDVITSVEENTFRLPKEIELRSSPNPFIAMTTLYITMPKPGRVNLALYDLLGRKVRDILNDTLTLGEHQYVLDAGKLASGVYIVKLFFENTVRITKIVLIK